jgi:methylmalonyl-CoA mutase
MNETRNETGKNITLIRNRTASFFKNHGRRPRILITRMDPMSSDRKVKIIATALADMGFDVDINTSLQPPVEIARLASENDVHVVGIPDISVLNPKLISELFTAFYSESGKKIVLAAWTHRKPGGTTGLSKAQVDKIEMFAIDADITDCANRILDVLAQQL